MVRRSCLAASLFAVGFLGFAALSLPPTALGQDKKAKDKDEVVLRAQLKDARQDLTKAEKQIAALQTEIREGKALVVSLQTDLKKATAGDATDNKTIQSLSAQLTGIRGAKYIHTSTWKRKSDTTDSDLQAFVDDARTVLGAAKPVRGAWAGKPPAPTDDFDAVLVLAFDDVAAFEKHKLDPQGKKFHDKHDKKFDTPKAVDFATK